MRLHLKSNFNLQLKVCNTFSKPWISWCSTFWHCILLSAAVKFICSFARSRYLSLCVYACICACVHVCVCLGAFCVWVCRGNVINFGLAICVGICAIHKYLFCSPLCTEDVRVCETLWHADSSQWPFGWKECLNLSINELPDFKFYRNTQANLFVFGINPCWPHSIHNSNSNSS